jgi:hypothetical protein
MHGLLNFIVSSGNDVFGEQDTHAIRLVHEPSLLGMICIQENDQFSD